MKKLNKPQNFNKKFDLSIKVLFFTLFFSWIIFNTLISLEGYSDFFAIILAITPLLGGIYSIQRSKDWGFYKSSVGLSLIFTSLGLFMWFLGQSFYYLDSKVSDKLGIYEFFFIFIDPLYLLGLYYLAKSIGTFNYLKSNISLIVLPILIFIINLLIASYLNKGDFFEIITNVKITDFYILGSIILATFTISILAFSKKLGGIYHKALLLILFGILFQFLADNLFAYFEAQEINGSLADLLFFISISLVTYGIYKLDPKKLNE